MNMLEHFEKIITLVGENGFCDSFFEKAREHIDHKGIAARDILEYGLVPVIDGWDFADTAKILDNLIAHETDPVRINIAQAKKEAVKAISEGENPRLLLETLCAFFDESIAEEIHKIFD